MGNEGIWRKHKGNRNQLCSLIWFNLNIIIIRVTRNSYSYFYTNIMVKFKTSNEVVNRGGKKYIAKDWVIEVDEKDIEHFDWFTKVEAPKKTKNENTKKGS